MDVYVLHELTFPFCHSGTANSGADCNIYNGEHPLKWTQNEVTVFHEVKSCPIQVRHLQKQQCRRICQDGSNVISFRTDVSKLLMDVAVKIRFVVKVSVFDINRSYNLIFPT